MQPVDCSRRSARIFLFAVACAAICAPAWGQDDGIVAGPFVITPWIESDVEADSNLFNAPESGNADSDLSASLGFGFDVILPFKQSVAEFKYNGAQINYENESIDSGVKSQGLLGVTLAFASGDELVIRDAFLRDFVQVPETDLPNQGPGVTPEDKFFGAPFHYNRFDIAYERAMPGRKGFIAQVGRRDFIYQEGTNGRQYDFRGWDNTFEYYQPFASNRKLVIHYEMRRFDHFRDCEAEDEDVEGVKLCERLGYVVGVPFRSEVSDTIQVGLSGLGSVRPFFFRFGYGRFLYESENPLETRSNFRGVSGFARWMTPIGGRSSVAMSLSRRPLSSSYATYYIGNQFRVIAERGFTPAVKLGLVGGVRLNAYADEIFSLDCDGLRKDLTWDAGFRASWEVHRMLALRLAAAHERRDSNCRTRGSATDPGVNIGYESQTVNLGIRVGWY